MSENKKELREKIRYIQDDMKLFKIVSECIDDGYNSAVLFNKLSDYLEGDVFIAEIVVWAVNDWIAEQEQEVEVC